MMLTPEQLAVNYRAQRNGLNLLEAKCCANAMADQIDAQQARIAELEQNLAATEQDAARYRIMRSYFISPDDTPLFDVIMREMLRKVNSDRGDDAFPTDKEFDSAVDKFYESTK